MSLPADPAESAEEAGLRYVTDAQPGLRRVRAGRGFRYLRPDGSPLADRRHGAWIKGLAIPPAWRDVWICPDRRGHLQATGRDARGRKQYRYHPEWRGKRDEIKYDRLLDFARRLPRIRRRVTRDLSRPGLPRAKVLAAVVRLLETTLLRVGNAEYARANNSFGLTTLRDRHAKVGSTKIKLRFPGKGGKVSEVTLEDRRMARVIGRLQDLPGQELFQYVGDDGQPRAIGSEEVNAYLHEITGDDFTAKDFRTWAGSVRAASALRASDATDADAQARRNVVRAMELVAEELGNTPAVSRSAYVHPSIIEAYMDGDLLAGSARGSARSARPVANGLGSLKAREAELVSLLRRRRRQAASPSKRSSARR
ncbi:MAG: DNA topoisomerase IB [Chloroflexi bacterium]|nr:MAG: DNA topoisomerase IB [Chloroflexota bacterium]